MAKFFMATFYTISNPIWLDQRPHLHTNISIPMQKLFPWLHLHNLYTISIAILLNQRSHLYITISICYYHISTPPSAFLMTTFLVRSIKDNICTPSSPSVRIGHPGGEPARQWENFSVQKWWNAVTNTLYNWSRCMSVVMVPMMSVWLWWWGVETSREWRELSFFWGGITWGTVVREDLTHRKHR